MVPSGVRTTVEEGDVTPLRDGRSNVVLASDDGLVYKLRRGSHVVEARLEAQRHQHLALHDVDVPALHRSLDGSLVHDVHWQGRTWAGLVSTWVPNAAPTEQSLRAFGCQLRKLHAVPEGGALGLAHVTGGDALAAVAGLARSVRHRLVSTDWARLAMRANGLSEAVVSHGDAGVHNARLWRQSARLVDFEHLRHAAPELDLGRVIFSIGPERPRWLEALLDGYGAGAASLSREQLHTGTVLAAFEVTRWRASQISDPTRCRPLPGVADAIDQLNRWLAAGSEAVPC